MDAVSGWMERGESEIVVISLIVDKPPRIAELCRRQKVRKLEVFGSAVTAAFDHVTSDVDMIVDLGPYSDDIADRYLDVAYGLERILGRPVDLITSKSIRNPYFRLAIELQRETVYEAGDREAAA